MESTMTLPKYMRDVIESVDLTDARASGDRTELYGHALVEYRSMAAVAADKSDDWCLAYDALDLATRNELGLFVRVCWRQIGIEGRWVRFRAA